MVGMAELVLLDAVVGENCLGNGPSALKGQLCGCLGAGGQ